MIVSASLCGRLPAQPRLSVAVTPVTIAPGVRDAGTIAGQLGTTLAGALKSSGRFSAVLDRDMNTPVFQELARSQATSNFESRIPLQTNRQTNAQLLVFALVDEVTVRDCEGTNIRGSDGRLIPRQYVAEIRMRLKFSSVESGETVKSERLVITSEGQSEAVLQLTSGGGFLSLLRTVGRSGCAETRQASLDNALVNAAYEFVAQIFAVYPIRIVDVAMDSLGAPSRFTVDAGSRHGLTKRQKFKVMEQVAMAFDDRPRLAQLGDLRIVRIEEDLAECEILSGGPAILAAMKTRRDRVIVKR
jgi:hypothetical protein